MKTETKFAPLAAAAIVLFLSGCGGEGGGGVNSTPAPPSYKTLDQLTGNQTFQTGGVHFQVNAGTFSGQGTDAFGHGLVIDYNDAAGTFTLTAPGGTTGTFTQADFVPAASDATTRVFEKFTGARGQELILSRPLVGGVQLSYLEVGQFADFDTLNGQIWLAVGGVPTLASDMPKSGTATYTAMTSGSIIGPTTANRTDDNASSATFSANFGTGAINTTLHLIGAAPTPTDYGTFTGTGSIASGTPGFTGSFAGTAGAGFSGAFFGPQAKEMGYTYIFTSGSNTVIGSTVGRKN